MASVPPSTRSPLEGWREGDLAATAPQPASGPAVSGTSITGGLGGGNARVGGVRELLYSITDFSKARCCMRANECVLLGNDEERRLEEAPARRALGGEDRLGCCCSHPFVVLPLPHSHSWLYQITLYQQPGGLACFPH